MWLRLKSNLDGDTVFASRHEQLIELAKRFRRKGAGGFEEHFQYSRPVAPDERIRAPVLIHVSPFFAPVSRMETVVRKKYEN